MSVIVRNNVTEQGGGQRPIVFAHEARRQMLNEDVDVSTAALDVGYESPTQFIREYRRLFGYPPLRHINALRAGGGDQAIL